MKQRLGALIVFLTTAGYLVAGPADAVLFSSEPQFRLECRLTVFEGSKETKTRDLEVLTLQTGPQKKLLVRVLSPSYLKSLKFLRLEGVSGPGTWLKTSKGVQRLAPGGDPEPLFGSDFTTTDFLPGARDWTPVTGESQPGETVYERSCEPRSGLEVQKMVLRSSDNLVLRMESYGPGRHLTRVYRVLEWDKGGLVPQRVSLEDLGRKTHSELLVTVHDPRALLSEGSFLPGQL